MDRQVFALAGDYAAGTFNGTTLDGSQNVSSLNHPALTPIFDISSGTVYTGDTIYGGTSTPAATRGNSVGGGGSWSLIDTVMRTSTSNDYFTISTSALRVTIQCTGILALGLAHLGASGFALNALRNGGFVALYDGATLTQTADLHGAAPQLVWVNPDGGTHTLKILFTGQHDAQVQPISGVAALVTSAATNTVLAGINIPASTTQTTFVPATWRVVATGTGTYSLYKTPQGGTESLIASGLTTSTTYDDGSHIPGVALGVAGSLTTNDSVTFTTDAVMAGIAWLRADSGSGGTSGSYTSPVIDSGAVDTHWVLAEFASSDLFTGATSPAAMTLSVGSTPVPNASWQTLTGRIQDAVTPAQGALPATRVGVTDVGFLVDAGGAQTTRARYAQWTFTFPGGLSTAPWIRDVTLFFWVPERDPNLVRRFPLPPNGTPGPNLESLLAWQGIMLAATGATMRDLLDSYAITSAADLFLQQIGQDLGMAPYVYTLIPPQAYGILLRSVSGNRPTGGSVADIARNVTELIAGAVPVLASAVTSELLTVSASASGLSGPVTVAQTAPHAVSLTLPSGAWPGLGNLPLTVAWGIVRALVSVLTPMGCKITLPF